MKDMLIDEFQYTVQELIFRNKSIVDSMTKFQDSNARVNRAIIKAVTQCGCIRINARKQELPEDGSFEEARKAMDTHSPGNCATTAGTISRKNWEKTCIILHQYAIRLT